ncbi:hypothetical protein LJR129_001743 [Acidovorax sp. LjRoot129]|uniref:hypothetical protein n=1 Tax=Acidovorax sp. LjRoot129 TaxID=3342260 RepID=UPI003ECF982E
MARHASLITTCANPLGRACIAAALAIALGAGTAPAHAFWGLLGKAAGGAGKAAGATGTAGKAAGAGTAAAAGAGAATLADDAARAGGKAAGAADAAAAPATGGAAHAFSAVNAALPPEVAVYLAKPAATLSAADTSQMMQLYQGLVAQAGKSGDFSVLERMPQLHGAKTLPPATATATAPAPAPVKPTPAAQTPVGAADSPSTIAEFNLAGLRLLAHAASAGHRTAQQELRLRCTDPALLRTAPQDVRQACQGAATVASPSAAKPRPAAP